MASSAAAILGEIHDDVSYPLPRFMQLTGQGRKSIAKAKREGLEIHKVGRRAYVLGAKLERLPGTQGGGVVVSKQDLTTAIRDLAAIDDAGLLTELFTAFRADCRLANTCVPSDRAKEVRVMNASAVVQAGDIAFAMSEMLGIPEKDAKAAAIDVLVIDPWREIALRTIADYRERTAKPTPEPKAVTAGRRRAW